jgi:hypothetical protein
MRCLPIFLLFFSHTILKSQIKDSAKSDYVRKPTLNSIYVQVLGTGIWPTLGYERIILNKQKWQLNAKVGFAYYPIRSRGASPLIIPVELDQSLGRKHHLDLGIGLTYAFGFDACEDCDRGKSFVSSSFYSSFRIGYKYKKPDGNLYFSFAVTPVIRFFEINKIPEKPVNNYGRNRVWPLPSLSAGYSF